MKKLFLSCISLALPILLFAQNPNSSLIIEPMQGPTPWTSLDFNNDQDRFQFIIVTDRTGGLRPGVFEDGVKKLNLLQPEFVMSVGDLIQGYTEDLFELNRQWAEFEGFVDQLQMPFFYVPGNHDFTNKVMKDLWMEKFGKEYYHFIYKDVLILCLNSEDQYRGAGKGTISDEQYNWIEKTLQDNPDVKWTLVFLHQPLWLQNEETFRWPDVEKLLADRKHTVFCGHRHRYIKYERNNGKYFMLATTGGGSRLRGNTFGEFDHVVWVTMTEEGPILANLKLQGIWNENVNTEEKMNYVNDLLNQAPVSIEPLLVEDTEFSSGRVRFKINNNNDVPLRVQLKEKFAWQLNGKFQKDSLIVNPNSVEMVDFLLEARRPGPIENMEPLETKIELALNIDQFSGIQVPFSFLIKPIVKEYVPSISHEVKLDGDLSEWGDLPMNFGNGEDLTVNFKMAFDAQYLYLAANVKDDTLHIDTAANIWSQDNLSWIVHAGPMQESILSGGGRFNGGRTLIRQTPATSKFASRAYREDAIPEGVQRASKTTATGYQMEIAIPVSYLIQLQGMDWRYLRFNLMVDDFDQADGEINRQSYHPNWDSADNFVGSGLLFRGDSN